MITAHMLGEVHLGTGDKPKARVQLLRTGEFYHPQAPNKKLKLTPEKLREFEQNFRAGVRGTQLPTNRDHDDPNFQKSPAWVTDMELSPDGSALHGIIEFANPQLLNEVKNGEVKFFSPELLFGWKNPEDGKTYDCMKGGAWTNVPYIKRMDPVTLLNLSEFATIEGQLLVLSCFADFKRALSDLISEAWPQDPNRCDWEVNQILDTWRAIDDGKIPSDRIVETVGKIQRDLEWVYRSVDESGSDGRMIRMKHVAHIDELQRKLMTELGVPLSEVRLAMRTGGPNSFEGMDPEDQGALSPEENTPDNQGVDPTGGEVPLDEDASDPNLPDQCHTCKLLAEGQCPFAGIQLKSAAAGNGNCPQYVPVTAQTGNYPTDDDGNEQAARFSEEKQPMATQNGTPVLTPEEKVAALEAENAQIREDNQGLKEALTALSEQVASLNADRVTAQRETRIQRLLGTGKITPHQATLLGEMLKLDNGGTVKLSEGDGVADVTLSDLIERFVESAPASPTPLQNDLKRGAVEEQQTPTSDPTQLSEQRWERWKAKALELNPGDWRSSLDEAIRLCEGN